MAFENDPFSQDVRAGVLDNIKEFGMDACSSVDSKQPAHHRAALSSLQSIGRKSTLRSNAACCDSASDGP